MLEDTSPLVKTVFFIQSMDCWLHLILMNAERERDRSKILTLGPFAIVMERTLQLCENHRDEVGKFSMTEPTTFYRGAKLS